MFDGTLMLQVNWSVVDPCTIHPQSNKFAKGVKIKATGELKLTTVFVDMRLWKTKHPQKCFQSFYQSCMLSTDRIEVHQSQPLV